MSRGARRDGWPRNSRAESLAVRLHFFEGELARVVRVETLELSLREQGAHSYGERLWRLAEVRLKLLQTSHAAKLLRHLHSMQHASTELLSSNFTGLDEIERGHVHLAQPQQLHGHKLGKIHLLERARRL